MGRKSRKSQLLDPRFTPTELDVTEDYIYNYTGEPGKRVTDWKEIYAGLISGKIKTEGTKLLSEYESFNSKIKFGGMDTMRRMALVRYLTPSVFGMLDPDTGNPVKLSKNDPDSAFYGITFKQLSRDRSEGEYINKVTSANNTGLAINILNRSRSEEVFENKKVSSINDVGPLASRVNPHLITRSEGEEVFENKKVSSINDVGPLASRVNPHLITRSEGEEVVENKEINKYKDELVEYVTKSEYDNQLKGLAQYISAVNTELNIADDIKEIEALNAKAQAIRTNMDLWSKMNADIRRKLALKGVGPLGFGTLRARSR